MQKHPAMYFRSVRPLGVIARAAILSLTLLVFGCSGGGGSDDSDSGDNGDGGGETLVGQFQTECGVVINGIVQNPVDASLGKLLVDAAVISSNLVAVDYGTGPVLVKLQGLAANSGPQGSLAVQYLDSLVQPGTVFFPAGDGCVFTSPDGGVGVVGQLINPNGLSVTEELLRSGVAGDIETSGSCGETQIAGCYSNIKSSATPPSAGLVTSFLWKPESEGGFNPGLLSILVDNCNVQVLVNDVELQDFGPSNGRCTTARSTTQDGCSFGSNVRVQVLDRGTGLPYLFPGNQPVYIIANGCNRTEFYL
jgi:hypothetical protein